MWIHVDEEGIFESSPHAKKHVGHRMNGDLSVIPGHPHPRPETKTETETETEKWIAADRPSKAKIKLPSRASPSMRAMLYSTFSPRDSFCFVSNLGFATSAVLGSEDNNLSFQPQPCPHHLTWMRQWNVLVVVVADVLCVGVQMYCMRDAALLPHGSLLMLRSLEAVTDFSARGRVEIEIVPNIEHVCSSMCDAEFREATYG